MKRVKKLQKKIFFQSGFTLVEILIVIAMLSVIATVLMSTLNPLEQIKKGTDAKRKSNLEQIQRALEMYYHDNNAFPASSGDYKIMVGATAYLWGDPWLPYINELPRDPSPGQSYIYYSPASSNGQTYYLYASLERGGKDPDACNDGNGCTSLSSGNPGAPPVNACGGVCNFGLSSSNVSP